MALADPRSVAATIACRQHSRQWRGRVDGGRRRIARATFSCSTTVSISYKRAPKLPTLFSDVGLAFEFWRPAANRYAWMVT